MTPSDDELVKTLLAARPGPEACPDANLLVGWAERRLEPQRAQEVEEHLAACDGCREEALLLRGELRLAAPAAPARRRWALRLIQSPLAIAALALVALGVGLAAYALRGTPTPRAGDTEARYLAFAGDLLRAEPGLFAGLVPDAVRTLPPVPERAQRGGVALRGLPRAFLAATRPTFAWEAVPGAEHYDVRLLDAQGVPLLKARTAQPTWTLPAGQAALAPGSAYVLEVRSASALGAVEGRRGFRVASLDDAAAFARAIDQARRAQPDLADLLAGHLALARGYTLEAERAVEAFLARHPDDAAGQRLHAHVRALLGRP